VSDPADVVKAGDKIKVRVLEVDAARKRIALSARTQPREPKGAPASGAAAPRPSGGPNRPQAPRPPAPPKNGFSNNPFGNL
jgi:uncharacterized protein